MTNQNETEADTRAERIDPVLAAVGGGHHYPPLSDLILHRPDCGDLHQSLLQKAFAGELT